LFSQPLALPAQSVKKLGVFCIEVFQIGPSLKAFRKSADLLNEWEFENFIVFLEFFQPGEGPKYTKEKMQQCSAFTSNYENEKNWRECGKQ
jgi:hypothetical protein